MEVFFNNTISTHSIRLFIGLSLIICLSIISAIYFNLWFLVAAPVIFLIAFIGIVDSLQLYYFLFAMIPLSVAVEVGGGFSTDLPTEPLLIGLTILTILHVFNKQFYHLSHFIKHPVTLLLLLHLSWTGITIITSEHRLIGFKFLLAKLWYVLPMYFMTGMFLTNRKRIYKAFGWSIFTMTALIIITLIRHSSTDFSFKSVNFVMGPWFINHVMYAAVVVSLVPILITYLFYRPRISDIKFPKVRTFLKFIIIGLFFTAIFLSYTRAAMISLFITCGAYYVIKTKLTTIALSISLIILGVSIHHLQKDNEYLSYAPEYTKAISHHRFDNLISATSNLEDVSTMERVYRWIAGSRMMTDRPLVGFGPGAFYSSYKPYTVTGFKTYVSENFDHSGIHNYFLMVFVEQGITGGIIFIILIIALLLTCERVYHRAKDPYDRMLIMAVTLGIIIILSLNLINDLLETDKVGIFFLAFSAIIVGFAIRQQSDYSGQ